MDFETLYNRENYIRSSKALRDYKANISGIEFATPFTSNAVLQREPHIAAVYGMGESAGLQIKLTLKNEENGASDVSTSTSMKNGDWKVLLSKSYPNGGNYTISVECPQCKNNTILTLYNVTFGDVYICTGQSNMWLPMEHTFNRNYTYANMSKFGKYENIRFVTPIGSQYVISDEDASFTRQIQNGALGQWSQSYQIDNLQQFSGACWYFAQTLQDKYNLDNITFGLINTALGGSVIESWVVNNTVWNFNTKSNQYCNSLDVNITQDYGWGCLYVYPLFSFFCYVFTVLTMTWCT